MKRGLVLVEGQTEERFVNECLAPYLLVKGLVLDPTIVKTKRVVGKPFAAYQKTLHGPIAMSAIGIDRIRATCPHVDQWLGRLEAITET